MPGHLLGVFEPYRRLFSWFTHHGQVLPTDHEISIYGTKSRSPSRTTSTGQGARRTTLSVVLPSKKCFRVVYPWVAITIRSTANSVATSTIFFVRNTQALQRLDLHVVFPYIAGPSSRVLLRTVA